MDKSPQHDTDQYLVSSALSGQSNAFRDIIRLTERLVSDICFKMIDNAEERKDIAQEIYLKAWKSLPGFRFNARLTTWAAKIAYNTCLNHLARKKIDVVPRLEKEGSEEFDEQQGNVFKSSGFNETELSVFKAETRNIIILAIETLSPVHKTMITLFHHQEMSYEEIAEITALPVGTVKSHLFRARKALKEFLLKNYKKEDL